MPRALALGEERVPRRQTQCETWTEAAISTWAPLLAWELSNGDDD